MNKIVIVILALVAVAFATDSETACRFFCKRKSATKDCQDRCKKFLPKVIAGPVAEETSSDMSNSQALPMIRAAGLSISSSGNCHEKSNPRCTSFDGIRDNTVNGIITLKRASGCAITITGGSEVGHAGGQFSHANGYKVDISLSSCIDSYITKNFANIGRRGDGSQQYKSSAGNVYAKEGNHWDITYY